MVEAVEHVIVADDLTEKLNLKNYIAVQIRKYFKILSLMYLRVLLGIILSGLVLKARSNNGAGPELMMESTHGEESVHVHSLRTTLGEHKQHFSSLRVSPTFHVYVVPVQVLKNLRFMDDDSFICWSYST